MKRERKIKSRCTHIRGIVGSHGSQKFTRKTGHIKNFVEASSGFLTFSINLSFDTF
jgi:hypothetical protein